MKFLKKDLEEIIWESNNEKLQEKGLWIEGIKKRQLRIGNYGIADLVTINRISEQSVLPYLDITVFELKKKKAGISAFLQAVRYCKGIKTYLEKRKPNILFRLNIVLCSKVIDTSSDYIFLTDLICSDEFKQINTLSNYSFIYGLDGIKFINEQDYDLTIKGF